VLLVIAGALAGAVVFIAVAKGKKPAAKAPAAPYAIPLPSAVPGAQYPPSAQPPAPGAQYPPPAPAQPPAREAPPQAEQAAAQSFTARIFCTRGHFAGRAFPLLGRVAIGRDPARCQIVFPNDAQGISSLHCELSRRGDAVMLTDRGSTYGTFLMDGRRLGANESVALGSGDGFYLADNRTEFKVL
jgi:hypothetical protein